MKSTNYTAFTAVQPVGRKKKVHSTRKLKYNLSKLNEYNQYLESLRLMSRGEFN